MSASELIVRVADLRVAGSGATLVTLGLGSCIAIVLHDAAARVGGMAHILLPNETLSRRRDNPAKFPQTAVPAMLEEIGRLGGSPRRLVAKLVGGASMFSGLVPVGQIQMGERNLVACRQVLGAHGIPVVGESVGGDFGRSVRFRTCDGSVDVTSALRGTVTL